MQSKPVGRGDVIWDTYDDAYAEARQLEVEKGLTFIHPLMIGCDRWTGTGMEILRQYQQPIHAILSQLAAAD
jgi:threonine dehydratase